MKILRRLVVVGAIVLVTAVVWRWVRGSERVVYQGGPILTMDDTNRVVAALATEDDRIVAIGGEADMQPWLARGARIVDLHGRTLLPGFIDAHSHFALAGLSAIMAEVTSPPVGSVRTIPQLLERLAAQARQTRSGRWIVGIGYDDTLLEERRHPTRAELDRVSADRPVVVFHVSGHLATVNTPGLQRLGYNAQTPDPTGGRIQRDPATNEPTGVLEESALLPLQKEVTPSSVFDVLKVLRHASDLYVRAGVTTAQNGAASATEVRGLPWFSRLGILPLRLVSWPTAEAMEAAGPAIADARANNSVWTTTGAVKLFADGSIQGFTAYLTKPYYTIPEGAPADYRGYPRMSAETLAQQIARYHVMGLQVAIHGNGDAAIDDILAGIAAAQRAYPRPDARHVVVHAQMTRPDQLDTMKALGVIPSFFSLHTYYWGDRHRDVFLGPERAARISPARSALERGLRFTVHADTPVTPMEPLRMVWATVNRRSTSGTVIGEAECIDAMHALRAVTIDAAYQHFQEHEKGSLEPGKLADLVILDRNPLDDPEHIDQMRVLETIIAGRTVYRAADAGNI
jgi:predicted amidohydrolase YtcJ